MEIMNYATGDQKNTTAEHDATEKANARQRRIDALRQIAGMWAERKDIPADGLEYERELRREWR